jgi:hypothetical protein
MTIETSQELCTRLLYNAASRLIQEKIFPKTFEERMEAVEKRVYDTFLGNLAKSDRLGCGYGMATLFMELETFLACGYTKFFTKEYINELHMHFGNYLSWADSPQQVEGKEEDYTFIRGLLEFDFGEVELICYEHLNMKLFDTYISRILNAILQ